MSHRLLLVAALMSPAVVACPVASDLEQGIRVAFDDDTWSVYKREGADSVTESSFYDTAKLNYIYHLYRGLVETRYVEMNDRGTRISSTSNYTYDFPLTSLDKVAPGLRLKGAQTESASDGFEETIPYQLRVQDEVEVNIGNCRYQGLPMVTRYDYEDEKEWVVLMYLPALGFSYTVEIKNDDGIEKYRATKIEKVKK